MDAGPACPCATCAALPHILQAGNPPLAEQITGILWSPEFDVLGSSPRAHRRGRFRRLCTATVSFLVPAPANE